MLATLRVGFKRRARSLPPSLDEQTRERPVERTKVVAELKGDLVLGALEGGGK